MKLAQIYEGWRNNLIPPEALKEQIDEVHKERMLICSSCKFNSKFHSSMRPDEHCTSCGCTLSAKTRCLSCGCPEEKWGHVLTREQEDKIKQGKDENSDV